MTVHLTWASGCSGQLLRLNAAAGAHGPLVAVVVLPQRQAAVPGAHDRRAQRVEHGQRDPVVPAALQHALRGTPRAVQRWVVQTAQENSTAMLNEAFLCFSHILTLPPPRAAASTFQAPLAVASSVTARCPGMCPSRASRQGTSQQRHFARSAGRQKLHRARRRRCVGRMEGPVRAERDARDGAALHGPGHGLAGVALAVACTGHHALVAAPGMSRLPGWLTADSGLAALISRTASAHRHTCVYTYLGEILLGSCALVQDTS